MPEPLTTEETIDRLAKSISPAYASLRDIASPQVRAAAASLIDLIVEEQLSVPEGFRDACSHAATLAPNEAIVVFHAWHDTASAARPERKTVAFVLENFFAWYQRCPESAREPWLAGIPKLAPAVRGLGNDGMAQLSEAMQRCDDHFAAHKLIESVASYALTTDDAIRAVTALAHAAATSGRLDLWLEIAQKFPAERLEENRDAEHGPTALASILAAAPAHPLPALELIRTLAGENAATVRNGATKLAAKTQASPDPAEFLADARELIEALGIRTLGAITSKLPNHALASGALELRSEFGAQAALRLLEKGSL
ncbi:MAG: hypothetical protein ABI972_10770 [Acidobacteriota bacterium]